MNHPPGFRRTMHALRPAAVAAFVMFAGGGPAATQTITLGSEQPPPPSEVERFCTGIADAARDRRYALQAEELKTLRDDVDLRIRKLEEKRAEYQEWMKRREAFLAQAEDGVVKIYSAMKPDAAAERLAAISPTLAAGILMKIETRKAGVILNEMNTQAAAALTGIMAAAAQREDPS